VCPNILPGNVRNELSVSVLFAVQYQGPLFTLILWSEPPAPQEQAEFQRHAISRKICDRVEGDGGKVIDSKPALLDHPFDLCEAKICSIVLLQRTARDESEVANGKDDGIEYRPVPVVERAVDEDVITF
jgi:hypothetical protein